MNNQNRPRSSDRRPGSAHRILDDCDPAVKLGDQFGVIVGAPVPSSTALRYPGVREPGVGGGEAEIVRFGAQSTLGYRKPGLLLLVNRRDLRLERASKQVEGKRGTERCMRNRLDEALPSFPCPEKVELAPFLGCRSRSGWKGSKTVPTEAVWMYNRCWPGIQNGNPG